MYKVNYNGKGGCHGKLVKRENLTEVLLNLISDGYNVHYVSEV
jgi:hypothetical protein